MAGEKQCEEAVRQALRQPIGFAPSATVSKTRIAGEHYVDRAALDAIDREIQSVVKAVKGAREKLSAFRAGSSSSTAAAKAQRPAPVDVYRAWTGGGTDVLSKRAPEEPTEAAKADPNGEALGLVKSAHAGGGIAEGAGGRMRGLATPTPRRPTGAVLDAYDRADRLEMAKAAGAEISAARIAESERLAEALSEFPEVRGVHAARERVGRLRRSAGRSRGAGSSCTRGGERIERMVGPFAYRGARETVPPRPQAGSSAHREPGCRRVTMW